MKVSNINFAGQFSGYRSCTAGLLPVNYDQIKRSRISFASGSTSLSEADRRFLDNIVIYIQADSTVERVFVDGHTDSSGSRIDNRALSEERANAVADYLIGQGIDADLVTTRLMRTSTRYHAARQTIGALQFAFSAKANGLTCNKPMATRLQRQIPDVACGNLSGWR